jgi:hypothetical protein
MLLKELPIDLDLAQFPERSYIVTGHETTFKKP